MEFIEFVEKYLEKDNIVLLPHQKRILIEIDKAIKDRKKIKIACLTSSAKSFYKELLKAYFDDEMKEVPVFLKKKMNIKKEKEVEDDE